MKKISSFLLFVLMIATLLLSACGGVAATATIVAPKVEPLPVAFIGIVNSMAGDQWVINGQTVTVSANVIQDGPFHVGDPVKVEGVVNPDGSFTVANVEAPTTQDTITLPQFGHDNSNDANSNEANGNDVNANDDNGNETNSNDDNGNNANSNDGNGNDANSNDDNSNNSNSSNDNGSNVNDDNGNDDNDNGGNDNSGNDNDDNSNGGNNDNDDNSNSGGDNDNGDEDNDNNSGSDG